MKTESIVTKAFELDKIVAVPRVNDKTMGFHRIETLENGLSVNHIGIREPDPTLPFIKPDSEKKYLIITPGLAFDKQKNRLGRGGGYYDRFIQETEQLHNCNLIIISLCFSEQVVKKVPVDSHDKRVDMIITDKEVIW